MVVAGDRRERVAQYRLGRSAAAAVQGTAHLGDAATTAHEVEARPNVGERRQRLTEGDGREHRRSVVVAVGVADSEIATQVPLRIEVDQQNAPPGRRSHPADVRSDTHLSNAALAVDDSHDPLEQVPQDGIERRDGHARDTLPESSWWVGEQQVCCPSSAAHVWAVRDKTVCVKRVARDLREGTTLDRHGLTFERCTPTASS